VPGKHHMERKGDVPVFGSYDVVVAGGGLAGVAAAAAAARAGARTMLVEKQPFAGGIAIAGMEPSICNFFLNNRRELILGGCPHEVVDRLVKRGGAPTAWRNHRGHIIFDVEIGKLVLDEMLEDAGVEILYDTLVVGVAPDGGRVRGLEVANRSGLQLIEAACVVDATGDNDVAARAGAPLNVGPMPHSFLFRLGNVDVDALVQYIRDNPSEHFADRDVGLTLEEALAFYEETGTFLFHHHAAERMRLVQGPIEQGRYSKQWGPFHTMDAFQVHAIRASGTMVVNTGYFALEEPDGARMSHFLRQGRKMAHHVAAFMREHFPGCGRSFVVATAGALGIRRTRWLKVAFTLTREIYDTGPSYPDAVGRGVVITKSPMHLTDKTFDIPLRCLLPDGVDGLVVGSGRGASCLPAELLRTMPVTMAVGQGAGVVAAVAAKGSVPPRAVSMSAVRDELRRQGVNLG